ncbi:MAG: mobile mystery protein B [Chitinophagales bacterium]
MFWGELTQGNFRKSNKNLGVDKHLIPTQLHTLCNDGLFWIENKTYLPDEMAIRFKHRIVSIHCFPNGNGRHSRLMADIIIEKIFGQEIFSCGAVEFSKTNEARQAYLHAVKTADNGDFQPLLKFARS